MRNVHPEINLLLKILDEGYNKKAWHGPNLRGSVRGVTAEAAAWRPGPGRHNIWEIVAHAAYWKYAVRRRLRGDKRGSFPLKGSNWFILPVSQTEKAWRQDLFLLERQHRMLLEAVALIPHRELHRSALGGKTSNAILIYGIAAHDIYHAGQIQLLKRLQANQES